MKETLPEYHPHALGQPLRLPGLLPAAQHICTRVLLSGVAAACNRLVEIDARITPSQAQAMHLPGLLPSAQQIYTPPVVSDSWPAL